TGEGYDKAETIVGVDTVVMRLSSNGALDTSFSDDGLQFVDSRTFETGLKSILQPDGKILVLIQPEDNVDAVARLLSDGRLDTSFAPTSYAPGIATFLLGNQVEAGT